MLNAKTMLLGGLCLVFPFLLVQQAQAEEPSSAIMNEAAESIPITLTMNASTVVDTSGISYSISLAPKSYSNELPTGVYQYSGTISQLPLTIVPDDDSTTTAGASVSRNDDVSSWTYSPTLEALFGSDTAGETTYSTFLSNFPQAGMYEFVFNATSNGGSSHDPLLWNRMTEQYLLQVSIANKTENGAIMGRYKQPIRIITFLGILGLIIWQ